MKAAIAVLLVIIIALGGYFIFKLVSDKSMPTSSQSEGNAVATITTNLGEFQITLYKKDVPQTVKNFITLAEKNFYDNLTFHRVEKGFVIQGGDPNGDGTGGPGYVFADELNFQAKSYQEGYIKGVVAMANAGPNTNGSQWFVMLADAPQLPKNYTIFGKVSVGQETVDKIGLVPVDGRSRPLSPVVIKKITISQ